MISQLKDIVFDTLKSNFLSIGHENDDHSYRKKNILFIAALQFSALVSLRVHENIEGDRYLSV